MGIETQGYVQVLEGLSQEDKVVTSAQFLIDSESNVQASLVRLNVNHKSEVKSDVQPLVYQALGIVRKVNVDKHNIVVSHEPVKSLNWPSMTMRFTVQKEVNLESITPDHKMHFQFVKNKNGYEIIEIMTH